jgi:hypothetical protein
MRMLSFRGVAHDPEQTHILAHALGVEGETYNDDVPEPALSLKPPNQLKLLESPTYFNSSLE